MTSVIINGPREDGQFDLIKKNFLQNKLAVFGLSVTVMFILLGLFAPFIAPIDPAKMDVSNKLQPPSLEHPFGTDEFGRDLFSRVILGTRISLIVAGISVGVATIIGVTLGLFAAYRGGVFDSVIMRIVDIMFAFPSIILALVLIAIFGPGLDKAIIALSIVYTPLMTRITRGSALEVRQEEYVLASQAYGESTLGIMFRDMLPNLIAPISVQSTLLFAYAIVAEAMLSFLGLGATPPTPSWGVIISLAQPFIETAPWLAFIPGFFISLWVLSLNMLGDGLRDALDPTTYIDSN